MHMMDLQAVKHQKGVKELYLVIVTYEMLGFLDTLFLQRLEGSQDEAGSLRALGEKYRRASITYIIGASRKSFAQATGRQEQSIAHHNISRTSADGRYSQSCCISFFVAWNRIHRDQWCCTNNCGAYAGVLHAT